MGEDATVQVSVTPTSQYSNEFLMQNETICEPLLDELKLIAGLKVKVAEPLARYTSIKIGGAADYFVEVENGAALAGLLSALRRHGAPFCLVGNGSNLLISDEGIRGAVVHLAGEFKHVEWCEAGDNVCGRVGAAIALTQLVRQAARRGYAGLEFAEGIPGTVGGALVMNAGAYGSEFEKIVEQLEGTTSQGESIHFRRSELSFTYRDSHLPPHTVVTRVHLNLSRAPAEVVNSRIRELVAKRKNSQPSGYPNCGSVENTLHFCLYARQYRAWGRWAYASTH